MKSATKLLAKKTSERIQYTDIQPSSANTDIHLLEHVNTVTKVLDQWSKGQYKTFLQTHFVTSGGSDTSDDDKIFSFFKREIFVFRYFKLIGILYTLWLSPFRSFLLSYTDNALK